MLIKNNLNMNYTNDKKLFIFLMDIRSLPDHFREMVTYLDCLNTTFKSIALTETWLKDHHTNYTLPNYNFEQTFRPKARGGGICLYIHSSLQYEMRRDLIPTNQSLIKNYNINQTYVNSLFIEIEKKSPLTKHNIIVGCIIDLLLLVIC